MRLCIYLGDQLLEAVHLSVFGLRLLQTQMAGEAMRDLIKKHKQYLTTSKLQPSIVLEGVPSQINGFQSLKDKYIV